MFYFQRFKIQIWTIKILKKQNFSKKNEFSKKKSKFDDNFYENWQSFTRNFLFENLAKFIIYKQIPAQTLEINLYGIKIFFPNAPEKHSNFASSSSVFLRIKNYYYYYFDTWFQSFH